MSGTKVFVKNPQHGMAGEIALKLGQGQYVEIRRFAEGAEVYVANMTRDELIKLLTGMGVEMTE